MRDDRNRDGSVATTKSVADVDGVEANRAVPPNREGKRPQPNRRRTAAGLFFTQAAVAVVGLPISIVLARVLGPEDYGVFQFLNRLALVLVTILCLGYPHAIAWASARASNAPAERGVVRFASMVSAFGGIAAFAVAAVPFLLGWGPAREPAWWIMAFFPLANLISANLVNFYRGRLSSNGIAAIKFTQVLSWGLFVGLGAALQTLTITWAVGAAVAAQFLSIVAGAFALFRSKLLFGPSVRADRRQITAFAFATYPGLALRDLNVYGAQLVVGFALSAFDLGIYSAALALTSALGLLSGPITNTTQPMVQQAADGERVRAVALSIAATLLVVGLPAGCLALVAQWLVPLLYGNAYAGAAPLVAVLAFAALFDALGSAAYGAIVGIGRPGRSSVSIALGTIVNFGLLLALMPLLGVVGAAIATTIANAASLFFMLHAVRTALKVSVGVFTRAIFTSIREVPTLAKLRRSKPRGI